MRARKEQTQTTPLWNEAQLNCVSLRSRLDGEVTWGLSRVQEERPLRGARDSPPVTIERLCQGRRKNE